MATNRRLGIFLLVFGMAATGAALGLWFDWGHEERSFATYTDNTHNVSFEYPADWREGESNRDGFFQIFNYEEGSVPAGHFPPDAQYNKIEVVVVAASSIERESQFPEERREERTVSILDAVATRSAIELSGGQRILSYEIPLDEADGNVLVMSAYGNPEQFSVLERMVASLEREL